MLAPLCAMYAFVCRSSWYLCKIFPLGRSSVSRLLSTHAAAALVESGLWVLLARFIVRILPPQLFAAPARGRFNGEPVLFGAGILLYLLVVAFHYLLLAIDASRQAEKREAEARVLAREAELKALKAQVNPHFLFNSLHSISALAGIDGARAREMCILLSDFLRSSLGLGGHVSIPLSEELALARKYLAVEQVRFGERMSVKEEIEPGSLDFILPPLLLQPLVENAVKHGIATLSDRGWIRLQARILNGGLSITIENNFDADAPPPRKNGVGLVNVKKRLIARYGNAARIDAGVRDDCYRVQLSLPAEPKGKP